ncbi:MAG TPA: hypothetical protein VLW53_08060 [Candidatus Eisenbacteria bacterium]|nr:hypothetical protein [Candidatus Eisenbacteria bacterium]
MGQMAAQVEDALMLADAERAGRALRVSWHHDRGVVVLSLWQAESCIGSFRLEPAGVPTLVAALVQGLAQPVTDRLTSDQVPTARLSATP